MPVVHFGLLCYNFHGTTEENHQNPSLQTETSTRDPPSMSGVLPT
jgi:hypothetical protein